MIASREHAVIGTCIDDATLAAIGDGLADPATMARIDEHIDHCATCRALIADLARVSAPVDHAELARGTTIGRYLILDTIGTGTTGVVYAAYDPELERKIAIKLLRPAGTGEREARRAHILAEARAMARLAHPNVVTVHEAGVVGEQMFIATELVEGVTLAEWLRSPRAPRAIAAVFADAGCGLAAAHRAGVVHCDFKPQNVLVSASGRVAVTDFGLARTDALEPALDGHGGGTPAYLAPERLAGAACDARADQFAFCVALFEALTGRHPFAGHDSAIDVEALRAGRIRRPDRRRGSERLRRIAERGLAPEPAARYPSMDALIDDLRRAVAPRRRAWLGAAAAVMAAGGVAVASFGRTRDPSCDSVDVRVLAAWGPARAEAARHAFLATGVGFARVSFEHAAARLDRAASDWLLARQEVCVAMSSGGDQAAFSRAACLEDRLRDLAAVGALFASADARTVEKAVLTASAIGDTGCTGTAVAKAPLPSPDPAIRTTVDRLRDRLAQARARTSAGDYQAAIAALDELDATVRAMPYAPVHAEYLQLRGDVDYQLGRTDAATADLVAAVVAAERGGHDAIRARALTGLSIIVKQTRPEEGLRYAQLAEAALDRAGDVPLLRANVENALALVLARLARPAEAEQHARRALAIWEAEDSPLSAAGYSNLASLLHDARRFEEAAGLLERALARSEQQFGVDHPYTAAVLQTYGNNLLDRRDFARAVPLFERALAVQLAARGPGHSAVALARNSLGSALNLLGRHREALAQYDACDSAGLADVDPVLAGYCEAGRASALRMLGRHDEAVHGFERAIELVESSAGASRNALGEIRFDYAQALRARGNSNQAYAQARRALDDFRVAGNEPRAAEVERWSRVPGK
jgi:eukaryotic-like serine/threonine-protein kinase